MTTSQEFNKLVELTKSPNYRKDTTKEQRRKVIDRMASLALLRLREISSERGNINED